MAQLDVAKIGGGSAGSVELAPEVFETVVKPHLFHAEVRRQLSRRRAGTHATKNRAAVSGGGAKPYRQKGTGRARQGTTRAPQFAGGGAVFGPIPRGYEHRLNKKARAAALRGALSLRQQEGSVTVADSFEITEFKTKQVVESLSSLGLADSSVLIVTVDRNDYLVRSCRNLRGIDVLPVAGLNVHDVLGHQKLLVLKDAVEAIHARFGAGGQG